MEEECILCGYEISDPICTNCLKKGVLEFLNNRPHLREEIENLSRSLEKLNLFNKNETRCITCKRVVTICDYCFNTKIYNLLKERNYSLSEEFSRIFNCGTNMITPEFQFRY